MHTLFMVSHIIFLLISIILLFLGDVATATFIAVLAVSMRVAAAEETGK